MIYAAQLVAAHVEAGHVEVRSNASPQAARAPAAPVAYARAPAASGVLPAGARPAATQGSTR